MIHHFVDDKSPDFRRRDREAISGAEILHGCRIIHSKGALAHRGKIRVDAGEIAAKGDRLLSRPKLLVRTIAEKIALNIGRREHQVFPVGGAESKARQDSRNRVELIFVENNESSRLNDRVIRNSEPE